MFRNGVTSRSANTSIMRLGPDSPHSIRLLPPVCLAVITTSCGEVMTDSMTAGLPVRMRLIREGVRINSECPTTMCKLSGPWSLSWPGAAFDCGAGGRRLLPCWVPGLAAGCWAAAPTAAKPTRRQLPAAL